MSVEENDHIWDLTESSNGPESTWAKQLFKGKHWVHSYTWPEVIVFGSHQGFVVSWTQPGVIWKEELSMPLPNQIVDKPVGIFLISD